MPLGAINNLKKAFPFQFGQRRLAGSATYLYQDGKRPALPAWASGLTIVTGVPGGSTVILAFFYHNVY